VRGDPADHVGGQDLAGLGRVAQTAGHDHGGSVEVLAVGQRLAGVEADAQLERARCELVGFDYHSDSVDRARAAAERAGLADRVSFEVATAKDSPGSDYDLVAMFDCLHDMGDPVGAARHALDALGPDGTWLIVEPFANDRLEDNLNPVGRVFYSASTMVCTPASRDQEVGLALGAQAGEARLREVVTEAGFTRFRRATETPFNLVLEARP